MPLEQEKPQVKRAFITGGSRGIGAACAMTLARAGFQVILTYRDGQEAAAAVAHECSRHTPGAVVVPLNLSLDPKSIGEHVTELITAHGPFNAVVHNAGYHHDTLLALMGAEAWREVLDVNLISFYGVMRPFARHMLRQKQGRMVTMASMAGVRGNAGQVNYAASKAGLIGATKSLALELAPRGITANAIAPGLIATDMTADLSHKELSTHIPMGRFGTTQEVANVAAFLCSDAAAYVTGQVIHVNGGLYT